MNLRARNNIRAWDKVAGDLMAGEFSLSVRDIVKGGKDVIDEYTKPKDNPGMPLQAPPGMKYQ